MGSDVPTTTRTTWMRVMAVLGLVVITIAATLIATQLTSAHQSKTTMSDSKFLALANRAAKEQFVATYVVKGNASPFIATGRILLASEPELASSHSMNDEDYSGFGQYYAYVFHESNGALVQWIQQGQNVSWCLRWRRARVRKLECTAPSPYTPSNGYAMQALPFVPTTVLEPVKDFFYGQPKRTPPVLVEQSKTFGAVRCLFQTSGAPHLRTCINSSGFLVSSTFRRGHYWWTVALETLSHDPTRKDFITLRTPTGKVPLPPLG
jgi:hypothetical protein